MSGSSASAKLSFSSALENSLTLSTAKLYELNVSLDTAREQVETRFNIDLDLARTDEVPGFNVYYTDQYMVWIDQATSYWTYQLLTNDETVNTAAFSLAQEISDEDAMRIAQEFVEGNHLWDGSFYNIVVSDRTQGGWNSAKTVTAKSVWFYPEVDDMGVLGIFRITVTMDMTGNITEVFKQVCPMGQSLDVPLINSAALQGRIDDQNYSASFSEDLIDAVITACNFYYYADAYQVDGSTYLYPVYVLSGDGRTESDSLDFDVIVDALP